MKIKIQTYKKQTIEYDEDTDKFTCDISINDRSKTTKRQSLKDIRHEIDTFIKENLEFKPFKLIKQSSYGGRDLEVLLVKGIRTDGVFIVESEKYKRISQLNFERELGKDNDYSNKYYEYDADIIGKMKELDKEDDVHRKQMTSKINAAFKPLKKFDITAVQGYIDAFKKPK